MNFQEAWKTGQVVRKHTMENIRAENIAEHTWGVVSLLMLAWPAVPLRIIVAAQFHDSGERATGDMPGPTKWANPILEAEMDRLEQQHITDTLPKHLRAVISQLSEDEWAVVEFFDRADFCMSMIRERTMGNLYAMIYFERALNKMRETFQYHLEAFREMGDDLTRGMKLLYDEIEQSFRRFKVKDAL